MRHTLIAALIALATMTAGAQTPAAPAPAQVPTQTAAVAGLPVAWARIPAGMFEMGCAEKDDRCGGDEHPRHPITLTKPFDMMTTEVTIGMYRAAGKMPDDQPEWSTGPDFPVVIVEWSEASDFCAAVGGRLPTEAEWEYAARAGLPDAIYPWGNDPPTDRVGAPDGAAFEGDAPRPVKTFGANKFGLFDMAGNVWEWVVDFGGFYGPRPETDPTGPDTGRTRVVRGGSYGDDAVNLRVSNRTPNAPDRANINVGFRCVRAAASL